MTLFRNSHTVYSDILCQFVCYYVEGTGLCSSLLCTQWSAWKRFSCCSDVLACRLCCSTAASPVPAPAQWATSSTQQAAAPLSLSLAWFCGRAKSEHGPCEQLSLAHWKLDFQHFLLVSQQLLSCAVYHPVPPTRRHLSVGLFLGQVCVISLSSLVAGAAPCTCCSYDL